MSEMSLTTYVLDMTIPGYAFAVVCILVGCFTADYLKMIWPVLTVMSGSGFIFFVATTAATDGMVRYVLGIFAFGTIYGCSPLTKTWISHVLSHPSEKRAVAIALINALGNGSSIYGSFLWPDKDSPRFIPGFALVTSPKSDALNLQRTDYSAERQRHGWGLWRLEP